VQLVELKSGYREQHKLEEPAVAAQ
jgi:hypothetical protein